MKLIFASNNPGKIKELQTRLETLNIEIIPQNELGVSDIKEVGLTFVENAILKARHACQKTGLPALADDSGLEVHALSGAPGIYSARYAGDSATSTDNIKKLLHDMEKVPESARSANFRCVLILMLHEKDPAPLICEGIWNGYILSQPCGEEGFGYDPIFYDVDLKCSAAQLPIEIKNQISHRGKALTLLLEALKEKMAYARTLG